MELFFSIGFALVGMLIQFAINKPKYDDDYDDEEDEDLGKSTRKTTETGRS